MKVFFPVPSLKQFFFALLIVHLTFHFISLLLPLFTPPIFLDVSFNTTSCASYSIETVSIIGRTTSVALEPIDNTLSIPIKGLTQSIVITGCNSAPLNVQSVSYRSLAGAIELSLADTQEISLNQNNTQIQLANVPAKTAALHPLYLQRFLRYTPWILWLVTLAFYIKFLFLKEKYFWVLIPSLLAAGLLWVNYEKLRSLFPPSPIDKSGIIAYTHFFGYSLTADLVLSNLILLMPLFVLILGVIFKRLRSRSPGSFKPQSKIAQELRTEFAQPRFFSLENIVVFLMLVFLLFPLAVNHCQVFTSLEFDSQNNLLWDYAPLLGNTIYKDIFYLYGVLFYYKSTNLLAFVGYAFIPPLLFTLMYATAIKPLFPSKLPRLIVPVLLFPLCIQLIGLGGFARYGILLTSACLLAFMTYYWRRHVKRNYFFQGLIVGFISFLTTADGIYVFGLTVVLHFVYAIFFSTHSLKSKAYLFLRNSSFFLLGFMCGVVPTLGYYLLKNDLLNPFLEFLQLVKSASVYAKIPTDYRSSFQIALYIIGFVGVLVSSVNVSKPRSRSYTDFLIIAITLAYLILYQKNLVRNIGHHQLAYGLLLLLSLISKANTQPIFKKHSIQSVALTFFFIVALLLSVKYRVYPESYTSLVTRSAANWTISPVSKLCSLSQVENWADKFSNYTQYQQVVDYIRSTDPNAKIFSYPYDPIFYILFKQQAAPYPNIYDGASDKAQATNIRYLQEHNINYIIYNVDTHIIDSVPEYLRTSKLHQYLLSNYTPINVSHPFVILAKPPLDGHAQSLAQIKLHSHLDHLNLGLVPQTLFASSSKKENGLILTYADPSVKKTLTYTYQEATSSATTIEWYITKGSGVFLPKIVLPNNFPFTNLSLLEFNPTPSEVSSTFTTN